MQHLHDACKAVLRQKSLSLHAYDQKDSLTVSWAKHLTQKPKKKKAIGAPQWDDSCGRESLLSIPNRVEVEMSSKLIASTE